MIKMLVTILFGLGLVSFAPTPAAPAAPPLAWAQFTLLIHAPPAQPCTWETAPARLRQQIEDPIGYPFGYVEAWSCDGDSQSVIAELQTRAATMQAQAAAYRAAHPLKR